MDRGISQSSPISEIYIQWKILCQKKKKMDTKKSYNWVEGGLEGVGGGEGGRKLWLFKMNLKNLNKK